MGLTCKMVENFVHSNSWLENHSGETRLLRTHCRTERGEQSGCHRTLWKEECELFSSCLNLNLQGEEEVSKEDFSEGILCVVL